MFGTPFGAYVDRDDPPIVYVFDTRDKFGAMRVGGVWRRPKSSPTIGDLAEDWKEGGEDVPPDETDDRALKEALDLLRGTVTDAAFPPHPVR